MNRTHDSKQVERYNRNTYRSEGNEKGTAANYREIFPSPKFSNVCRVKFDRVLMPVYMKDVFTFEVLSTRERIDREVEDRSRSEGNRYSGEDKVEKHGFVCVAKLCERSSSRHGTLSSVF